MFRLRNFTRRSFCTTQNSILVLLEGMLKTKTLNLASLDQIFESIQKNKNLSTPEIRTELLRFLSEAPVIFLDGKLVSVASEILQTESSKLMGAMNQPDVNIDYLATKVYQLCKLDFVLNRQEFLSSKYGFLPPITNLQSMTPFSTLPPELFPIIHRKLSSFAHNTFKPATLNSLFYAAIIQSQSGNSLPGFLENRSSLYPKLQVHTPFSQPGRTLQDQIISTSQREIATILKSLPICSSIIQECSLDDLYSVDFLVNSTKVLEFNGPYHYFNVNHRTSNEGTTPNNFSYTDPTTGMTSVLNLKSAIKQMVLESRGYEVYQLHYLEYQYFKQKNQAKSFIDQMLKHKPNAHFRHKIL